MSEAVLILRRSLTGYGDLLKVETVRRERAEPQSEEFRASQHNIGQIEGRIADISDALRRLGEAV